MIGLYPLFTKQLIKNKPYKWYVYIITIYIN